MRDETEHGPSDRQSRIRQGAVLKRVQEYYMFTLHSVASSRILLKHHMFIFEARPSVKKQLKAAMVLITAVFVGISMQLRTFVSSAAQRMRNTSTSFKLVFPGAIILAPLHHAVASTDVS